MWVKEKRGHFDSKHSEKRNGLLINSSMPYHDVGVVLEKTLGLIALYKCMAPIGRCDLSRRWVADVVSCITESVITLWAYKNTNVILFVVIGRVTISNSGTHFRGDRNYRLTIQCVRGHLSSVLEYCVEGLPLVCSSSIKRFLL